MKKNNNKHLDNINLVKEFVDILNKDDLSELEYESEELKIKIVSKANNSSSEIQHIVSQPSAKISSNELIKTSDENEKFTNKHPGAVNSPMVGTAYSAPEPGKEPFVKLNSLVKKGDTLLIIEAMKVMNTITAHKSGKVSFIGFEDSQPVEFDQMLIIIE
ncbi:acetyl-CoA carboxylase biotin carboxyl carrier protein subunit [Alphaproteobacteria bacterium]|nr:acetyl-CoA carboxylase biotin carboxyl carrier protein subunit [Alphaproteobacteria bacterium]